MLATDFKNEGEVYTTACSRFLGLPTRAYLSSPGGLPGILVIDRARQGQGISNDVDEVRPWPMKTTSHDCKQHLMTLEAH